MSNNNNLVFLFLLFQQHQSAEWQEFAWNSIGGAAVVVGYIRVLCIVALAEKCCWQTFSSWSSQSRRLCRRRMWSIIAMYPTPTSNKASRSSTPKLRYISARSWPHDFLSSSYDELPPLECYDVYRLVNWHGCCILCQQPPSHARHRFRVGQSLDILALPSSSVKSSDLWTSNSSSLSMRWTSPGTGVVAELHFTEFSLLARGVIDLQSNIGILLLLETSPSVSDFTECRSRSRNPSLSSSSLVLL